jgi:catechol 2,3-dioxygenase-like lactoylglutathione lyase family enzyme
MKFFNKNLKAMKNILLIVILIIAIVSVSFNIKKVNEKEQIVTSKSMAQVAVVVKDIDKARDAWAQILGIAVSEASVAESHFSRPTKYKDSPSDAQAKLAFISLENIQIELIQPLGGNSTWQEFLDTNGEGIHHIAFWVKDIEGVEKQFELQDMPVVQTGGWDGGAYSYIDASKTIGCIVELLENFN